MRATPELDATAGLTKLAGYPFQIATWVDDAGYPVSVAVDAVVDATSGTATFAAPAGLTVPTDREVSLTVVRLPEGDFTSTLLSTGTSLPLVPGTALPSVYEILMHVVPGFAGMRSPSRPIARSRSPARTSGPSPATATTSAAT